MDCNQLLDMIGQYTREGKDIGALYGDAVALCAGGKNPLGLNQWVKSDKPIMEDFNEDNRIVDKGLRELQAGKVNGTNIAGANAIVYVRKDGSDTAGTGSEVQPFLTISRAVQHTTNVLFGKQAITILIGDGVYEENLRILAHPFLAVRSLSEDAANVTIRQKNPEQAVIYTSGCSRVIFYNLTLECLAQSTKEACYSHYGHAALYNCIILNTTYGAVQAAGSCQIHGCEFRSCKTAISAREGATIYSLNCTGSNNQIGLSAASSTIYTQGSVPAATTARSTSYGGQILS